MSNCVSQECEKGRVLDGHDRVGRAEDAQAGNEIFKVRDVGHDVVGDDEPWVAVVRDDRGRRVRAEEALDGGHPRWRAIAATLEAGSIPRTRAPRDCICVSR